jgi:hypothetical protein
MRLYYAILRQLLLLWERILVIGPLKKNGAYTERISIGPELMQVVTTPPASEAD